MLHLARLYGDKLLVCLQLSRRLEALPQGTPAEIARLESSSIVSSTQAGSGTMMMDTCIFVALSCGVLDSVSSGRRRTLAAMVIKVSMQMQSSS